MEDTGNITATFTEEPNCFQQVAFRFYTENQAGEVVEIGEAGTGAQPGEPSERSIPIDWEGGATTWQYPIAGQHVWKVSAAVEERIAFTEEGREIQEKECPTPPPPPKVAAFLYVIGAR